MVVLVAASSTLGKSSGWQIGGIIGTTLGEFVENVVGEKLVEVVVMVVLGVTEPGYIYGCTE
jgi:hypothetical protein